MSKKTKLIATLLVMAQMITLPGNSIIAKAETNTDNNAIFEEGFNDFAKEVQENTYGSLKVPTEEELKRAEENELTQEEVDYYNGNKVTAASETEASLPSVVDNFSSKYFPNAINQTGGTCWAYSSAYYQASYVYNKANNIAADSTNALSPIFVHNFVNSAPDGAGGNSWETYDMLSDVGCATRKNVNFSDNGVRLAPTDTFFLNWHPDFATWKDAMNHRFVGYTGYGDSDGDGYLTESDFNQLKEILSEGEVLSFANPAWYLLEDEHITSIKESNIAGLSNSKYVGQQISYCSRRKEAYKGDYGYHQLTVVGYDDNIWVDINADGQVQSDEKGAFQILNSWGETAHNGKPYFWLSYDAFRKDSKVLPAKSGYVKGRPLSWGKFYNIIYNKTAHNNSAYLKLTLDTAKRTDINISIEYNNNKYTYRDGYYSYESYNYSMYGNKDTSETGTIVIPLDNVYVNNKPAKKLTSSDVNSKGWKITIGDKNKNSKPVVIKNLQFIDESTNLNVNKFVDANNSVLTFDGSKSVSLDGNSVVLKPQLNEEIENTKATVYYSKKSNFTGDKVYIHYNKNGQGWTSVPGKLMTSTTEQSGYQYKFEVDLENTNGKLVYCFNDGNNHWDSRNGLNYECTVGTYGVSNEQQKTIDTVFAVTALDTTFSQSTVNGTIGISANAKNASGTVNYKFTATDSNGNVTVIKDYSTASSTTWRTTSAGTYTLKVEAKDSTNKVVSKSKTFKVVDLPRGTGTFDKQSPQSLGSTIKVNVNGTGGTGTLKYQLIAQGGNYQFGGREIYVQKFSTNKSISWTPEVDGEYALMLDIKDETGAINRVSLGHYIISKDFGISSFTADKASPQATGKSITLTADAKNATGTVQYQFTAQKSGSSASVIQSYSTKNTCSWYAGSAGTYTLTVSAKDSTGKVVTKTMSYEIKTSVGITSVSVDKKSPQEANTTINIKVNTRDGIGTIQYRYSFLSWNGIKTVLKDYSTSNTFAWTPKESMVGFLYIEAKDASENSPSAWQMDYSITPATAKMTTIYYKGYSNPYIHYKIGNGTWTTAPGMNMSSNSDVDGYYYAITIDLGQADKLTACFNNGSGAWDSNNGSNYTFGAGYYTFSNGKITKIEKPSKELKINSITCSSGSTIKMGSTVNLTVNASGGQGPYTYYLYYYGYGSGRINYRLNGVSTNTATFMPDYPRDITFYAEVVDSTGKKVTYSQVFTAKEITSNQTTIYYKGYDNAYIHYKIGNGSWTNAPGVKMESTSEKPGYTHKITLDLGDAEKLTACFNNGSSQWDNNGGKDYTFGVGTYTISNGVITKVN